MHSSLTLLLAATALGHQNVLKEKGNPLNDAFAQLVEEKLASWEVPGCAIAVVDGDDVWAQGYGIAEFPDKKATPDTLWYAGSTTKAFTAAVMATLVDDNANFSAVQWDTPISKLIRDDFVLEDDWATAHITLEDAFSHRTGMPRHDYSYGGYYNGHKATVRDIVRSLRHLPLAFPPRTTWSYCNTMYVVVSHVIESLTGRWLGDLVDERLWKPLGMESTYFSIDDALDGPNHVAQGYFKRLDQDGYEPVPYMNLQAFSGAGSVISSVLDYSKWMKAIMNKSLPISESSFNNLFKARSILELDKDGSAFTGQSMYALGWELNIYRGHRVVQHTGGMEGFNTNLLLFPDLNYGVIVFTNTDGSGFLMEEEIAWSLIDDKLDVPSSDRVDWVGQHKKYIADKIKDYKNATATYYPNLPTPTLPLTLPIASYVGTYNHPGYQNFTLTLDAETGTLHAERDVSWKMAYKLEHVSGEGFLLHFLSKTVPILAFREISAAEFRIGRDGLPSELGMALEPKLGIENRIWFQRVEA